MKTKHKEFGRFNIQGPVKGKRDYYFHADEDFREDRNWGKNKTMNESKPNSELSSTSSQ